jgi:sugar lactone lactonase YvrE
MRIKGVVTLAAIVVLSRWPAGAQIYDTNNDVVQTFAGSGFSGYVDGVGQQTMFNNPSQIVVDSSGNFFVLDSGNYRIRKITPEGTVSTFVGGGHSTLPEYGTNVSLSNYGSLRGMAIDHSDALWITAGVYPANILRIGTDGYTSSKTNGLWYADYGSVCVDSANNVYFADGQGNRIYRYRTNDVFEVFAGSGNQGSQDGNGIFTSFFSPAALAADAANNIYVFDFGNHLIRRIAPNGDVVTVAGSGLVSDADGQGRGAAFVEIYSMCADNAGNIIMACGSSNGSSVRKMAPSTNVFTLAGSFTQTGYADGPGNLARFSGAHGVCISTSTIYVADSSNQRIRSITNNSSVQVVSGANLGIGTFTGVTITGIVGRTYQLQSSPDMASWTTQATLLLNSSPYLWIDQTPVSGKKFYRAFLLP